MIWEKLISFLHFSTHSLIQQNVIDCHWLLVNPVILGKGIPLFQHVHGKVKLKLMRTHQLTGGVVELNYLVDK